MTSFLLVKQEEIELLSDTLVYELVTKGALLLTDSGGDLIVEETDEEEMEGEFEEVEETDDQYFILNPDYKFSTKEVEDLIDDATS